LSSEAQFLEAVKQGDAARVSRMLDANPALAAARAESGESAVLLAVYYGKEEVRELLVARGVPLDVFEAAAAGVRDAVAARIKEDEGQVRAFSHDGFTPLHLAAFFGRAAVVELLLSLGAPVNEVSRNPSALRPLHSAVAHRQPQIALEISRALIAAGADVNATYHSGWTALHAAAVHGNLPLVRLLLESGAKAGAKNDAGQTPADLAKTKNHKAVIASLAEWAGRR
jgi:ankyrin repeat protein